MEEGELAWYALQVFHGREERLEGELASEGWEVFLPRRWSEVADAEGRTHRRLVLGTRTRCSWTPRRPRPVGAAASGWSAARSRGLRGGWCATVTARTWC